jgi:hypothetical protein
MKVKVSWDAGEKILTLDERFYSPAFVYDVSNEIENGHDVCLAPKNHRPPNDYFNIAKELRIAVEEVPE